MEEPAADAPQLMHCPECWQPIDVSAMAPYAKVECPHCSVSIRVRTHMGQYEITGVLGEGGMSQVFRAYDRHLGREVALKILHHSLGRDESLVAMFEREAKLTASIIHPNVVKVFTVGQDQGYLFIAMELLQAEGLDQLIAKKGALSESAALGIALDVARGLKAAYDERLIHRDIKPGNLLVTNEGTTKLVDFGLALHQDGEELSEELWATPFYVPPEKLDGRPDTFLGDIYSLGATLYHALAGKPPFDANTSSLEELKRIKTQPVDLKAAAPGLSKATVKLVETMMAYRAEDRIPSYEELISRIEDLRKKRFGIVDTPRRRSQGLPLPWIFGGVGALLVLLLVWQGVQGPAEESGGAEFGIGKGERVITASESSVASRFLAARDHLAAGRWGESQRLFGELADEPEAPVSTRMWSRYYLACGHLFRGDLGRSNEEGLKLLDLVTLAGDDAAETTHFLKRVAGLLSNPLPLLPEECQFASDNFELLGLLSAGLKNWQHGEFDSAHTLLQGFVESSTPGDLAWIEPLKGRVKGFLADYALLRTLPNPRAAFSEEELNAAAEALQEGLESLRSRGAAPKLVQDRLARIEKIRELAALASTEPAQPVASATTPSAETRPAPEAPPAAADPARPTTPPTTTSVSLTNPAPGATPATGPASPASPAPGMAMEGLGQTAPLDPATALEMGQLRTHLLELQPLNESLRFAEAVERLRALEMTTAGAQEVLGELLFGYAEAERYLAQLAERLPEKPYEGPVKRRTGSIFQARVSALQANRFVVDLGFGRNEIALSEFPASWIVEVGAAVLPPLEEETASQWQALVYFDLFTGGGENASQRAGALASLDPAFAARWQRLQRLR